MILTPINPALLKVKWIFTLVKNYKNYTFSLWVAHTVVYEKAMRFLKMFRENKKDGQRKLILAALFTIQIDNYALTFHRDAQRTLATLKTHWVSKCQQSTQSCSVLQEVNLHQVAERFPDDVCCPLHKRHFWFSWFSAEICSNFSGLRPISYN